jgi:hypothetical protein
MRTLKLVLLAMVLGFASTPTALAQGLPSDVEEKFGLRPNQPLPRHVRQDLLQEYRYHRRREALESRARRRHAACERQAYREGIYGYEVRQFMRWCMSRR